MISICFLQIEASVNDSIILNNKVAPKLSDYGFFKDMSSQEPSEEVLPYELITPLFSDYADKLRFIYIPKNQLAEHRPNKVFDFPNGTVLIKTFAYLNKHQEYIYNKIYVGDAFKLVDQINKKYELTLIIDVLEHFDYQDGISLIKKCLSKSKNILISVPKDIGLQDDLNDNKYEIHRFQFLKKHFKKLGTPYSFLSSGSSLLIILGPDARKFYLNHLKSKWVSIVKESLPGYWMRKRLITKNLRSKNK